MFDTRQMHRNTWILLAVLILLGATLRLTGWHERSLWQDEVFTLSLATGNPLFEATLLPDNFDLDPPHPVPAAYYQQLAIGMQPWEKFVQGLQHNVQMPLYTTLVRGWLSVNPDAPNPDPFNVRIISLIFGILAIPLAFLLGRELKNNRLGLLNASVVTLSGFQIVWSQNARVYALLVFIVLLSTWLAVRICRKESAEGRTPASLWFAFLAASIVGVYCHYFYAFILAFHALFMFWQNRTRDFLFRLAGIFALIALAGLLWVPMFLEQKAFLETIGHGNLKGLWDPVSLIERTWSNLLAMISPKGTPAKIVATAVIVPGLVFGIREWRRNKTPDTVLVLCGLWLLCVIGGLIAVDVVSQTHRILSERYLILSSPALYLLLAYAIIVIRPVRLSAILGIALALLMGFNSTEVLSGKKFLKKEDYRGAGRMIREALTENSTVIISHSAVHAAGLAFYLPPQTPMLGISRKNPGARWEQNALETRLQTVEDRDRLWMVFTHVRPGTLKERLRAWLDPRFTGTDYDEFSSVQVLRYEKHP